MLDWHVVLAGLIVGLIVGATGMGGGALMTPILILLFKVQPLAAVSSDLVASMIMKPFGAAVHFRRGTVKPEVVRWLVVGSVPGAFGGVFAARLLGQGSVLQYRLKLLLGLALVMAAATMLTRGALQVRRGGLNDNQPAARAAALFVRYRAPLTALAGAVGGVVVGLTSVGSGSLIIIMLMLLYPMLRGSELVGTDLVQAIPLVTAAAVGHLLFGDFRVALTASIVIGGIPGVYIGARFSSRASDRVVRPVLAATLAASGLKLLPIKIGDLALIALVATVACAMAYVTPSAARTTGRVMAPLPAEAKAG